VNKVKHRSIIDRSIDQLFLPSTQKKKKKNIILIASRIPSLKEGRKEYNVLQQEKKKKKNAMLHSFIRPSILVLPVYNLLFLLFGLVIK
jgi:hypothetical protein